MKNPRQNGQCSFGPSLRKPSTMKKPRSKLMKRSLDQLEKTPKYFRVPVPNRNNKASKSGNDGVAKKARPRSSKTYDSAKMGNANDQQKVGAKKMQQIPLKEPCNTRVAPWPSDLKLPSSSRPNNGSSRPNDSIVFLQKNPEKPRPSSSRPNDSMFFSQKNPEKSKPSSLKLNGVVLSQKNTKKANMKGSRPSSSRPNNAKVSSQKNTEKSRPSFSRPNNAKVSPQKNTEKSRPSRLMDGVSLWKLEKPALVGRKHDSSSTLGILKKSHPSPVVRNSSNIKRTVSGEVHKEDIAAAMEASNSTLAFKGNQVIQDLRCNSGNDSFPIFGKDFSSHGKADASCMGINMGRNGESPDGCIQLDNRNQNTSLVEDDRWDDDKFKSKRTEPLLEERLETCEDDSEEAENCRPMKKRRRYIPNEDEEDDDSEEAENCRPMKKRRRYIPNEDEEDDAGDKNLASVESATAGLTTQTAIVKDRCTDFSKPFVSESLKLQQYTSLPIDEPIWRGIFKIGSKEYGPLAAHLSTKCCGKVWKLSRSLLPLVEVTKLSRLEAWPKSFEASTRPTDEDIALYFLPHEMRPNADLDHLVKDVVENDMVLRAVVGEAEMLIFPSFLLPEQHQTFQGKPYLWGVFKHREEKAAIMEEPRQRTCRCAQEQEMGIQHASHRGVGKEGYSVAGLNMDVGLQAPKEAERQGIEQEPAPSLTQSNPPHFAEGTARPTSAPTEAEAPSPNHGQIHSSLGVSTGAIYGFVLIQTPKHEELIQGLEREGAVVFAMRGEMIGSGLGPTIATG